MSLPQFSDNDDEVIELLRQIRDGVGQIDRDQDVTIEGSNIDQRIGVIPPNTIRIVETDGLENVDSGGPVTLSPGETATLARFRGQACAAYAVGMSDRANVRYWLEVDGNPAVGPTTGPLGTVNDPFSFVNAYGGAVPAQERIEVKAEYSEAGSGDVNLVARVHLEVL